MRPERIIHQMWLADGPDIPPLYAEWCDQWRDLHPDWQYIFWTGPPELRNCDLFDRADKIVLKSPQQFQADVARYEILHEYGGVWMDADTIPHKPLDDLMDGPWVVRHSGKWVANGILAFPVGHPVLAEAIERLPESVDRAARHWGNTRRSGPQFFTPLVQPYIRSGDVRVLAEASFLPYNWDEIDRHGEVWGEYGTHVFANQRRKRGMELTTLEP